MSGSPDDFVSLAEFSDPVSAEMVADVLRQEGIAVTVSGMHHTGLLGVAGGVIGARLKVPRRDAARAEDLVAALQDEHAEVVDDPNVPEELRVSPGPSGPRPDGPGPYRDPARHDGGAGPSTASSARFVVALGLALTFGYLAFALLGR